MAIRYRNRGALEVAEPLSDFIEGGVAQAVGLQPEQFWSGLGALLTDLAPLNRRLLARRDALQSQIDHWYRQRGAPALQIAEQEAFLRQIGYLAPQGPPFQIGTGPVDAEIATIAGPQLVVPLSIPRYALNAANARWGSLYDALYGTDAIPEDAGAGRGREYNPLRGAAVIAFGRRFLDQNWPLRAGSHAEASAYALSGAQLQVTLRDGTRTALADANGLVGFRGSREAPSAIVLRHHGLHAEIEIDRAHPVGRTDPAGIADLQLESAITVIMDMEDSVAAVDATDKVALYRNWLGLITGELTAELTKGGHPISRHLNADREFTRPDGVSARLPGRSLMLIRNVGHLMSSDLVRIGGEEAPEGILDAVVSSLVGMHDLKGRGRYRNSTAGSIYIVKPKMHGPEEAAFANQLFDRVEDLLGLPRHTVKIGVMDEERRTSVNLSECVRAVKDRIIFINTGFLDRTGDEIHTAMQAGPVMRKGDMKGAAWLKAYEDHNVQVGLACGFPGRAQIGKGMWAMPDKMADMLASKAAHPQAGASTAWVPSPTAATLHALHYHQVDVAARQAELRTSAAAGPGLMLQVPVVTNPQWTESQIREELENNTQGILGYVVRWIDQGIGCSKVPDIRDVGLMEDRATLRISSQHIANWLLHGIVQADQVRAALKRMAAIVDRQNAADPAYRPMAADFEHSVAFSAACDLIFKGTAQPNGYTEPLLHAYRRALKGD
jgi:malate synthase